MHWADQSDPLKHNSCSIISAQFALDNFSYSYPIISVWRCVNYAVCKVDRDTSRPMGTVAGKFSLNAADIFKQNTCKILK